jgi:pimeloyl-ACP methyl ester carboxylesterase
LVVQILLDRGLGAAGVAIDSAPPKGVWRLPLSQVKALLPVLSNPLSYWQTVALTYPQFRYAFANTMSESEARTVFTRYAIPAPGRPVLEAKFANVNPRSVTAVDYANSQRAPLLLIAGTDDHIAPASVVRANYDLYRGSKAITSFKEFPGRSHLIIAQDGWQQVAEFALSWAQHHDQNWRPGKRAAAGGDGHSGLLESLNFRGYGLHAASMRVVGPGIANRSCHSVRSSPELG